mmetsp:Transcript_12941/g.17035  ORF Transcript_12941/g.17035 Transcript_12941/m.17035 type:complete len:331 (+) Transcript_12941:120-1112(+)|eukprot:CAMPEP_0117755308 /NCGR_PEP_ID=MMETSP0947-20121206/13373_1 /TAXON_ID=44440 /ORGANISM="Chattonella subsalsa, Strain CCMP2191" /LENGTH=330 /DNA_ID=CAMNT_0005574615 /DNA_START=92 /DNA_END=1084 /DNA_ORIENTATION=-
MNMRHDLTLEDFQNFRFLVDGGMSRVFTAEFQKVPVVVKMVKPEEADNKAHLKALENEKRLLMGLSSPYIIKLIASGRHEKSPFIVVEKLLGTDLSAVLSFKKRTKQKLDENGPDSTLPIRVGWALEIALAMKYLHFDALEKNKVIIHRDLKSNNIGLGIDGKIRLLDFGIATEYDHSHDNDLEPYRMTTKAGTQNYCAPEVRNSEIYNEKCDVYSFGILLWEILTGLHPFNSPKDKLLRLFSCSSKVNRRPPLRDNWDPNLQQLIKACWDEVPTERPDFQEICLQLKSISSSLEKQNADDTSPNIGLQRQNTFDNLYLKDNILLSADCN